jgi:hypothetical protein
MVTPAEMIGSIRIHRVSGLSCLSCLSGLAGVTRPLSDGNDR